MNWGLSSTGNSSSNQRPQDWSWTSSLSTLPSARPKSANAGRRALENWRTLVVDEIALEGVGFFFYGCEHGKNPHCCSEKKALSLVECGFKL